MFITHGASNHSTTDRVENDYYATEPKAVELLLEKEQFSKQVWECAVGGGHIAEILKQNGYEVYCTDIVDRGYPGTKVLDFLEYNGEPLQMDIITNPPYSIAKQFVEKALDSVQEGHKVAMFLKLQFLEGKSRRELFKATPPVRVYVASGRLNCAPNGDFAKAGSALAYAWYIWEKGFTGKPTIDWIN